MLFSAILLAAGESRRMGDINKLALPVNGQPLLRRTAETLMQIALQELVVVVGHQQQTARELIKGPPLDIVVNENYGEGQMTSVHCGMRALKKSCDAVLVCLSDLPLLEAADLEKLIAAFADCPTSILVPTFEGQRGNPIIMDHAHRAQILAADRNLGCKRLIQNNPELVTAVEMDSDHVIFDLDTPAAYETLKQRLATQPAETQTLRTA